jgi:hypothetical protein
MTRFCVFLALQESVEPSTPLPTNVDDIWLVSFMNYDLGYFDLETGVLEPLENPFGPKVLPMCSRYVLLPMCPGRTRKKLAGPPGFAPGANGL